MGRPEYLASGELARLIPADSRLELRNTSVTYAILAAVDEFAEGVFGAVGAPTGKRAKSQVWLEPVFKAHKDACKERPDAPIVVDNGRRQWRALLEAKVRNATLATDQIERYLDIARAHGIDAVITLSHS